MKLRHGEADRARRRQRRRRPRRARGARRRAARRRPRAPAALLEDERVVEPLAAAARGDAVRRLPGDAPPRHRRRLARLRRAVGRADRRGRRARRDDRRPLGARRADDRRPRLLPRPAPDGARAGRADRDGVASRAPAAGTGAAFHEVSARYRDYAQVAAAALVTLDADGAARRRARAAPGRRDALPRRRHGRRLGDDDAALARAARPTSSRPTTSRPRRRTGAASRRVLARRALRDAAERAERHDDPSGSRSTAAPYEARGRAAADARRLPARRPRPHRHAPRLRARLLRQLQRPARRRGGPLLPAVRRPGARPLARDGRRRSPRPTGRCRAAAGVHATTTGSSAASARRRCCSTAHEFLRDHPGGGSDEAIREAISGVTCRCTGYQQIVEAIQAAAAGTA